MAALEAVVEPGVAGMGYELGERQAANGGRMLGLFIDKPGGIDVEDCAAVSRQLSRVFEVEGIEYERLEVSSPGLDRPLRKAGDFARFAGHKADVRMRTPDATGRRRFVGVLRGAEEGRVAMELEGQTTVRLPRRAVERAGAGPGARGRKRSAATSTRKQMRLERSRDAEREQILNDFLSRGDELVTGTVKRMERGNAIIESGRLEALLPREHMIPKENLRVGDRVRAWVAKIDRQARGPQLILSRTAPQFIMKLFEL